MQEPVIGGGLKEFPLLLFDGERERYIGDIHIHPTYEYKPFQVMISSRVGVSPNQISIYLIDRRTTPKPPFTENRRRIPITGKVNFGLICRQTGCCFLVVLKRTQKSRNRKEKIINGADVGYSLPEYDLSTAGLGLDQHEQVRRSIMTERMQRLMVSANNYLTAMANGNLNWHYHNGWRPDQIQYSRPRVRGTPRVHCADCEDSDAKTPSFHSCVNDSFVTGFYRSFFGPVSRPNCQIPKPRLNFVPFSPF